MAKYMQLTEEQIERICNDFKEALGKLNDISGEIKYTIPKPKMEKKIPVFVTEKAWIKMVALVSRSDKEIAWHGVVYREAGGFYISDIVVYPQQVTGVTVETDQVEYETWLYEQEDEVFNNLRMQGHSHVSMGVTPSATDTKYYDELLEQLDDDMFYMFMILNKNLSIFLNIYDKKTNMCYELDDCELFIMDGSYDLQTMLEEADKLVKPKKRTYESTWSGKKDKKTSTEKKTETKNKPYLHDYYYDGYNYYMD